MKNSIHKGNGETLKMRDRIEVKENHVTTPRYFKLKKNNL